jgi:hypothetical protein
MEAKRITYLREAVQGRSKIVSAYEECPKRVQDM